jgi:hypothetical protein
MSHMAWKNDPYRQARGGYARLLAVSCATCGMHLFYYTYCISRRNLRGGMHLRVR